MGEQVEKLKRRYLTIYSSRTGSHNPRVTTPSSSDSDRCTRKLDLRSMSTPAKIFSIVMAAVRAETSFALSLNGGHAGGRPRKLSRSPVLGNVAIPPITPEIRAPRKPT